MSFGHHGIYVSNVFQLSTADYQKVATAKFKRALVRLDTSPDVARQLVDNGLKVVLQAVDCFNNNMPDPARYAWDLWHTAQRFKAYSNEICLDNEPNVVVERSSNWWAEQFARWFRAVMAAFRYYDGWQCHWNLVHPAFCWLGDRNPDYWFEVSRVNLKASDILSVHCYWQESDLIRDPTFGGSWKVVGDAYPNKRLYISEYCPDVLYSTDQQRAEQIKEYLEWIEYRVAGAYYFILGGTNDWRRYWLSDGCAEKLGELFSQNGLENRDDGTRST